MKAKSFTHIYLEDAFNKNGCPVCNVVDKYVKRYLDNFLYENVNSPVVRKNLNKTLGFCNQHAWMAAELKDGLGISIVYEDLLSTAIESFESFFKELKSFQKTKRTNNKNKFLPELDKQNTECPACKLSKDVEENTIVLLINNIKEPVFNRLYKKSDGLCLKHLKLLIEMSDDPEIIREILNIERDKILNLISQLQEYQRKHDYRFSHEAFGEEKDSWIRAIAKIVGIAPF